MRNAAQSVAHEGTIRIRTARRGDRAVTAVADTGCGMSEEVLSQLFTPFFTTKGNEGMGLGLRMSKAAIERQGGRLDCRSTPGKGTCFSIRIPLQNQCRLSRDEASRPMASKSIHDELYCCESASSFSKERTTNADKL